MDIAWNDQLSVGIEIIDSEHKRLIKHVNVLMQAIRRRNRSDMLQSFGRLEDELRLHFENEKKIVQDFDFDLSTQELAQQYVLNELLFVRDLISTQKSMLFDDAIEHFIKFLRVWMIDHHVNMIDMRVKHALQASSCNLETDAMEKYGT